MNHFIMDRQNKIDKAQKQKKELDAKISVWSREARLAVEAKNRLLTPEEFAFMPGEFRNRQEVIMKSISNKNKEFGIK